MQRRELRGISLQTEKRAESAAQGHPGEQAGRACVSGAAQEAAQDRQGQGRGQRDSIPGAAEKELCIALQL